MENNIRIKPEQTGSTDYFPLPNKLVCVEVPKVFDQVSIRDCVNNSIVLLPGSGAATPFFIFKGAEDFNIVEVKVISKTDVFLKPGYKKLKLLVKFKYSIYYSDGVNQLRQMDDAVFSLFIHEIYCPDYFTRGVIQYPDAKDYTVYSDGLTIRVNALAQAFNDEVNPSTGLLRLQIGVFFIVKCECVVQLLMPAYGYCPSPPEQNTPSIMTCAVFKDQRKTPFPAGFYPLQKAVPLNELD